MATKARRLLDPPCTTFPGQERSKDNGTMNRTTEERSPNLDPAQWTKSRESEYAANTIPRVIPWLRLLHTILSCLTLTLSRLSHAIARIKRQIWQRKWTKTLLSPGPHTSQQTRRICSFLLLFFFSLSSMYIDISFGGTLSVAFLCGAAKTAAGLIAGFRAAQLVSRVVYVSFVRDIFSQLHLIYKKRDHVPFPFPFFFHHFKSSESENASIGKAHINYTSYMNIV